MINSAAALDLLVFMLFVYITDVDNNITPREIQKFNTVINKMTPTKHPLLHGALESLRPEYSTTWEAYDSQEFHVTIGAVKQQLDAVCLDLSLEDATSLKAALNEFAHNVHQPAPTRGRMGSDGAGGARLRALGDIERLLELVRIEKAKAPTVYRLRSSQRRRVYGLTRRGRQFGARHSLSSTRRLLGVAVKKVRCVSVTPETPVMFFRQKRVGDRTYLQFVESRL